LRLFSFGGYGLALAALALVFFGAIECPPALPATRLNKAGDLRKKNGKNNWNLGDNNRCKQLVENCDFRMSLFIKLTNLSTNNCIKLKFLIQAKMYAKLLFKML